ncbi:hypothetical protein ABZ595_29210 [Streptomyces rubradiris]
MDSGTSFWSTRERQNYANDLRQLDWPLTTGLNLPRDLELAVRP